MMAILIRICSLFVETYLQFTLQNGKYQNYIKHVNIIRYNSM